MPLSRLLAAFDDALMPLKCVFCGTRTTGDERHICVGCIGDLPAIVSPPPAPGSPLVAELAPYAWAFPVDAAIKALKFRRRLFYAPALAQLLCAECKELPPDIDRLTPHLEAAMERIPCFARAGIKRVVNGAIPHSADGPPLLGPAAGLKNFWLC